MEDQIKDYEEEKRSIRSRTAGKRKNYDLNELDDAQLEKYGSKVDLSDVVQVGSKIIIGGGVGLLAGVLTKVTGAIGGALGLTMGLNKYQKAKKKRADT
jgi:hypothetical protein